MVADGDSELWLAGGDSAGVPLWLSSSASLLQATGGEVARLPAELRLQLAARDEAPADRDNIQVEQGAALEIACCDE